MFFTFFFLKSKVKFIFKIEVGESGVDFKKYRVEVRSRESILKNLESESGVGSRLQKIQSRSRESGVDFKKFRIEVFKKLKVEVGVGNLFIDS